MALLFLWQYFVSHVPKFFRLIETTKHVILVPGSAGGGVASGDMNRTIQQFLESFARESLGTPSNSVMHWV